MCSVLQITLLPISRMLSGLKGSTQQLWDLSIEKQRLNCKSLDYKGQFILKRIRCYTKCILLSERCFTKRVLSCCNRVQDCKSTKVNQKSPRKLIFPLDFQLFNGSIMLLGRAVLSQVNIYFHCKKKCAANLCFQNVNHFS